MVNQDGYYTPDENEQPDIAPYREKEEDPNPEDHIFEIGLVMAGAISAGCYSAGVLDFLIEALDAWELAKSDSTTPQHQVRIRVIAGASAGGMNAAIAANVLNYDFPHINPTANQSGGKNPLYDSWVDDIDIDKLLEDNDLRRYGKVISLLDCTVLQDITNKALSYVGKPIARRYLQNRVRFIFTQTSLRGTPYFCPFPGNTQNGKGMVMHKTWRSFSVNYSGMTVKVRRPDDIVLNPFLTNKTNFSEWAELGNSALASGAFPLALAPRLEHRPITDLDWRFVVTSVPNVGTSQIVQLKPYLGAFNPPPLSWQEYIVDGGMMDNEPLELARMEMSGINNNSPRDGAKAFRAVIMIDPFPQTPRFAPAAPNIPCTLLDSLAGIFSTVRQQLRFNPADLALALDERIYSRFMVAPVRSQRGDQSVDIDNDWAIASGSLGGFGGFLSKEFRRHDYLLGRRNCQQFLRANFSLPTGNSLFTAGGDNKQIIGKKEYPIIPLLGTLATEEPLPAWPTKHVDLDKLGDLIDLRAKRIIDVLQQTAKPKKLLGRLLMRLLNFGFIRSIAIKWVKDKIRSDLHARSLPC